MVYKSQGTGRGLVPCVRVLLSKHEDAEFGPQHPHHRADVASPDGNHRSLRGGEGRRGKTRRIAVLL